MQFHLAHKNENLMMKSFLKSEKCRTQIELHKILVNWHKTYVLYCTILAFEEYLSLTNDIVYNLQIIFHTINI